MRWFKVLSYVLLFLMIASVPYAKQWRQELTGGIEGVVLDQAGIPIAQARIQACNTMRGGCSATVSTPNGAYRIEGLEAGRYSLWAEARMHNSEWTPMIIVEEGQMTRHDIQLRREIPTITALPSVQ